MAEIRYSKRAEADFERIWTYIALDNEAAADRLLRDIAAKIDRLREFPEIGARRDEIKSGARVLVHGRYLVFYAYEAESQMVTIVAIVEGMRDLGGLI